jgi:hypothetical protein
VVDRLALERRATLDLRLVDWLADTRIEERDVSSLRLATSSIERQSSLGLSRDVTGMARIEKVSPVGAEGS